MLRNLPLYVWDFAAVAVLLHRPVHGFFLGNAELAKAPASQGPGYSAGSREPPRGVPYQWHDVPREVDWRNMLSPPSAQIPRLPAATLVAGAEPQTAG